jgi:hypothetical protein
MKFGDPLKRPFVTAAKGLDSTPKPWLISVEGSDGSCP